MWHKETFRPTYLPTWARTCPDAPRTRQVTGSQGPDHIRAVPLPDSQPANTIISCALKIHVK